MSEPLQYGIRGTVTPASKEKLDKEIAELTASGEKPEKLKALIAVRATMGD